ncbi:MAG: hypothetical protein J0L63_07420 [Anaerolineae bacterium]|mgnify:CR=1 FL=1|nr:hypothetical protein [Anaerolineae bacterium]MBN8618718.1 hypothetical protein [Anaerolineae bacterium]
MSGNNGTGETIQDVTKELGELGRELRQRANDIRKEAVKQLNHAAESIRREAREDMDDESAQKTADEVAKGLEKAAHYLNTNSVEQMGQEATRIVKKNPVPSLLVILGIGILIGLLLRGGKK